MRLRQQGPGGNTEGVDYEVECYEASIKVDVILSYPWLAESKFGIFPHHKALVLDSPELTFLYGTQDRRRFEPSQDDFTCNIQEVKLRKKFDQKLQNSDCNCL